MFAAMLDTCVLWPSLQRDFLLSMAVEGLYRPLWSEAILDELHRHETAKQVDRSAANETDARQNSDRLLATMRHHFADALVTGWEPLEGSFGLPDADDEHVVTAAVVGGAGVIVTDNLKDFPRTQVPGHIELQCAREFAASTADVSPERAARALCVMSARLVRTPHSPRELLTLLVHRYAMDDVFDIVSPVLDRACDDFCSRPNPLAEDV